MAIFPWIIKNTYGMTDDYSGQRVLALLDRRDNFHPMAKDCLDELTEPLITPTPVITEVCYLLQNRVASKKSLNF
jgi:predicted nucleic acid-binding protein